MREEESRSSCSREETACNKFVEKWAASGDFSEQEWCVHVSLCLKRGEQHNFVASWYFQWEDLRAENYNNPGGWEQAKNKFNNWLLAKKLFNFRYLSGVEVAKALYTVLICCFMDKAESRVTPRLFTLDAKGIRQPAKTMESLEIPDSAYCFPSTIASVLS